MSNSKVLMLAAVVIVLFSLSLTPADGLRVTGRRQSRIGDDTDFERYAVRANRVGGSRERSQRRLQACPAGSTACGSLCTDIKTDPGNCGKCGAFCASTQTCCSGTCADLTTDLANCGACGSRCPGTCAASTCNYGGVVKAIKGVKKMAEENTGSSVDFLPTYNFPRFHLGNI
eukprot:TRINITY_DN3192_c0_g1_i1.p1 TRINITY_DN3192_c0_g1~~TRINITY_DN3192_c0_g1_i1.p1  ORF type:complete len:173 (+),score=9.49 TRINITY_DN3192_c0_g1_i1:196-714(+)